MAEVKRGYRKVTAIIPVATYELLRMQAEDNDREVGQQAAFLLRKTLAHEAAAAVTASLDDDPMEGRNGFVAAEEVDPEAATVE